MPSARHDCWGRSRRLLYEPPLSEPAPSLDLYTFDNVILTPHTGSATQEARTAMALQVVANLVAMVNGERPPGLFNPEAFGEESLPVTNRIG